MLSHLAYQVFHRVLVLPPEAVSTQRLHALAFVVLRKLLLASDLLRAGSRDVQVIVQLIFVLHHLLVVKIVGFVLLLGVLHIALY